MSAARTRAPWSGAALGLVAAALFGASTPLAKLLLGAIDPWLLAGLLYLGSGLGLGVLYAVRRASQAVRSEASLRRADLPWLIAVIATGGVLAPVLLMVGLSHTEASAAALLLNLEGLATMALAWLVFRENVDRRILLGAGAILAGAVLLTWQDGAPIGWGALAIVGACIAWGVDNNLTRRLSSADPVQIAMVKGAVAGVANCALAATAGAHLPAAPSVLWAGLVGFLGYGVSLVLFVRALRSVGTARTSAYFTTAPFLGAVLSIVLLGEPLTLQLVIAGALMAVGLYLHLAERHQHEHVHSELFHEHPHLHDDHHQHSHAPSDPPGQPHVHGHRHIALAHSHAHFPDLHHRHDHPA